MKSHNYKLTVLFFFFLLLLSFLYGYNKILFYRPYSNHIWRQSDCLSITLNYYKEDLRFLQPEINWVGNKDDGKTISEFPIIYYTVAQFWKLLGQREFIFRLINILLVFCGLFALFKLSYSILEDQFWGVYVPLLLFTSPLLIFYTNNFLPNAPAFGMALTAAYCYYLFLQKKKRKFLFFSMLLFTLSGLLKITSLIIFLSIFSLIILEQLFHIYKNPKSTLLALKEILPFIVVLSIIAGWYYYAHSYNHRHHSGIFLQGIFPIWELSLEKRQETLELFYWNLVPSYFNKKALLIIATLFVFTAVCYKKTNRAYLRLLLFTVFGIFVYSILFFRAFHVHDYYLTNLLIFIPLTLVVFLDLLRNNFQYIFKSKIVKALFLIVLIILVAQGASKNRLKYNLKNTPLLSKLLIPESERQHYDYYHWDYNQNFRAFETITPYLRSIGLDRKDKVLSISDGSINISLYMMDQNGVTMFANRNLNYNERIDKAIKQNCKYLIITDKDLLKHDVNNQYTQKKIGKYQNINIYKLD